MLRINKLTLYILAVVGGVWLTAMINMLLSAESGQTSVEIQADILRLSEQYVKQLARESQNTIDGPFASRQTGYDMKKTMAVLLEELVQRMDRIEQRLNLIQGTNNSNIPRHIAINPHSAAAAREIMSSDQKINLRQLIMGAQEDCSLTESQQQQFPHCLGKLAWMRSHWTSDVCYAEYGVDGTDCSIRAYLSEVENWCPLLPGRIKLDSNSSFREEKIVKFNYNIEPLLSMLKNPGSRPNYNWIRDRVKQMWPAWVASGKSLQHKHNMTTTQRKILVHMGFLSKKSGFRMAETSLTGGPLGELVQWSDIICTLFILGHEITITSEYEQLAHVLSGLPTAEQQCQYRGSLPIDMIFTDIVGLSQFKRKVKNGYGKFSCLLRIVDSFGTEPAYNFEPFAKSHRLKTSWGMQNLDPRQFYTMFPHSPDNSFMGFVIDNHISADNSSRITRINQGVVYGKAEYMWLGKESYLDVIRQYVDIHATVFLKDQGGSVESVIPKYVVNHGVLPGTDLHKLLRQSKLFIGLGFPYEGPAPLEAIAQGNVFINPKFNPPHSSLNTKFFKGKPTMREVTSQHPYAELYIGPPHVHTVDIDDKQELHQVITQAIRDIDAGSVHGFIPYEFTQEGMLQRVAAYIKHQDFCNQNNLHKLKWPPTDDVHFFLGAPGQSCKDTCWKNNRICEPTHFSTINDKVSLEKHLPDKCTLVSTHEHIYFPAYRKDTEECILQGEEMLFSCVGAEKSVERLCPCRTYIPQQLALCKSCL